MTFPDNSPACGCRYCADQGGGMKARSKHGAEVCSGGLARYAALYGEPPDYLLPLHHFDEVSRV